MKKLFSLLFVCVSLLVNAQDQDPKAKAILDDLSKTTKAYKSITADYVFTILNKEKKQVEKQAGKVLIKGNKFKLDGLVPQLLLLLNSCMINSSCSNFSRCRF